MEVDGGSLGRVVRSALLLAAVGTLQDALGGVGHVEAVDHVVHIIGTVEVIVGDVGGKDAAILAKAAHDEVEVVREGDGTAEGTVDEVDVDRVVGPIVADREGADVIPAQDAGGGRR